MFKQVLCAAFGVTSLVAATGVAAADDGQNGNQEQPVTLAVYGDAPYDPTPGTRTEFDATPRFVDAVNADPVVSGVLHVGDIHSGSQACTEAYNRAVAALWTRFADPLVYTPGDNEWADCHKKKQFGGAYDSATGTINYVTDPATGQPVNYAKGNPVENLNLVRSIFFAQPGQTLGGGRLKVQSQAKFYDRKHPADSQFVENVLWEKNGFIFVTLNLPGGSNNDADPWYGTPSESAAQITERSERSAADERWLDRAFTRAGEEDAAGVVIQTQADMWSWEETTAHEANYEPFVASIASHAAAFKRPVLLLNGDSHVYRSDNPLQPGSSCTGDTDAKTGTNVCTLLPDSSVRHPGYNVPNFHRITVHGSTVPLEFVKLTADPSAHNASTDTHTGGTFGAFSWTRVME
jgi:hypothetical protein